MKPVIDINDIDHTIYKTLGISKEKFLTLPKEYQRAFLFHDWQICNNRNLVQNKEMNNSDNIENIKKKILSIFK